MLDSDFRPILKVEIYWSDEIWNESDSSCDGDRSENGGFNVDSDFFRVNDQTMIE